MGAERPRRKKEGERKEPGKSPARSPATSPRRKPGDGEAPRRQANPKDEEGRPSSRKEVTNGRTSPAAPGAPPQRQPGGRGPEPNSLANNDKMARLEAEKRAAEQAQKARAAAEAKEVLERKQQQQQQQPPQVIAKSAKVVSAKDDEDGNDAEVEEEEGKDYGEEEFDNYDEDDDFADEEEIKREEAEIKSIKAQMEVENQRVLHPVVSAAVQDGGAPVGRGAAKPLAATQRKFVPIVTRSKATRADWVEIANKNTRAKKILAQVSLSEEGFDLFEFQPVSKHDQFMRNLGLGKVRNIGIQFNEDWIDNGTQTDVVDVFEASVQYPDELGGTTKVDAGARRLQRFMHSAVQVIEAILEEGGAVDRTFGGAASGGGGVFSDKSTLVELPPWFGKRRVVDISFQASAEMVFVAYSPVFEGDCAMAEIGKKGVLCLWDTKSLKSPYRVLTCDGVITCCATSPRRGHIVLAGLEEGSVALWDIREAASLHSLHKESNTTVRSPTFTTDSLIHDNHSCPIKCIVVPKASRQSQHSMEGDGFDALLLGSNRNSFQCATLDEMGGVGVWTVIELKEGDQAGSEIDLGLGIGGRVKIIKSASIQDPGTKLLSAFHMACNPEDGNEFIVGGLPKILRLRRFGAEIHPSKYAQDSSPFPDACVAVAFCPVYADCFLAGFKSGTLCLFSVSMPEPIVSWFNVCEGGVRGMVWSTFRPSVFFVLDGAGKLMVWDLLQSDQVPSQVLQVGDVSLLSLSQDTGGDKDTSMLAIQSAEQTGALRLHVLKDSLGKAVSGEREQLIETLEHFH